MKNRFNVVGELLPDDDRTSALGAFIRRTGIDELPQLINILLGEMSFIGPRPFLPEYLLLYSAEVRKRHFVKPGITGLAQVNGGNSLEWEKRFIYDLIYVKNISLWQDLKIVKETALHLFKKNCYKNLGPYNPQKRSAD